MTFEEKHYLLTRDNLTHIIHIQLSEKQKTFWEVFFAFSKSIIIFKDFPKIGDPHRWCISGNTGSKKYGYINVEKAEFQRTLGQTTPQMDRNTVGIWMTAPYQYLLITVKVAAFPKVSFSDTQNTKAVF